MAILGLPPRVARTWPSPAAFVRRFGKFAVVGIGGTAVHLGLFWLLSSRLGLHYLAAGAIGIEGGICCNYILNNNWTFADRRTGFVSAAGLSRYHAVSFGGMLLNLSVLALLTSVFGVAPFRFWPRSSTAAGMSESV